MSPRSWSRESSVVVVLQMWISKHWGAFQFGIHQIAPCYCCPPVAWKKATGRAAGGIRRERGINSMEVHRKKHVLV